MSATISVHLFEIILDRLTNAIQEKLAALPWDILEDTSNDLLKRYTRRVIALESRTIALDGLAVARAAAKYGRALAHVVQMYRHLAAKAVPFELEVSVDETETPTTPQEHVYLASELERLGIQWVSQATRGLVHLKTAGTSYVEALRVVAQEQPALFRDIIALACARYPQERTSYHVSAEVGQVPDVTRCPDEALAGLLDEVQTRQVVHVTFGSVLATFGSELKAVLQAHPDVYERVLDRHFYRHLLPFAESSKQ